FILGLTLFCIALALLFIYKVIVDSSSVGSWIGAVLAMFFTTLFGRGLFTKIAYSVEKVEGEVQFVKVEKKTGSIGDQSYKRKTVSSYEMHVGGESFSNANPTLIDMMQGDIYAIYYVKGTKQILSVELLSKRK